MHLHLLVPLASLLFLPIHAFQPPETPAPWDRLRALPLRTSFNVELPIKLPNGTCRPLSTYEVEQRFWICKDCDRCQIVQCGVSFPANASNVDERLASQCLEATVPRPLAALERDLLPDGSCRPLSKEETDDGRTFCPPTKERCSRCKVTKCVPPSPVAAFADPSWGGCEVEGPIVQDAGSPPPPPPPPPELPKQKEKNCRGSGLCLTNGKHCRKAWEQFRPDYVYSRKTVYVQRSGILGYGCKATYGEWDPMSAFIRDSHEEIKGTR